MGANVQNEQNRRRKGEATLGRKIFSVAMSGLLVWSMWPTGATTALADELAELTAATAESQPDVAEQPADNADAQTLDAADSGSVAVEDDSAEESGTVADSDYSSDSSYGHSSDSGSNSAPSHEHQNTAAQDESADEQAQTQVPAEADIALNLGSAYITYNNQDVTYPSTKVTVPTSKSFKFTATANEGYELTAVYLTVGYGEKFEIDPNADGVFTVEAADVIAGAAIELETEKLPDSATTAEPTVISENTVISSAADTKDMGTYNLMTNSSQQISFEGYTGCTHKWTSSNESAATVNGSWDSSGTATTVTVATHSAGAATITDSVTKWVQDQATWQWKETQVATLTFTVNVADPYLNISGPTTVKLGDSATFTADTNTTVVSWQVEGDGKGCVGPNYLRTTDTSFTISSNAGWNFNGNTTTIQVKACYGNNLYSDPFEVTITKRSFYVSEPPSFSADSEHYWVPTLYDSDTNEEVTTNVSGAYVFEYYKDGVYLGNQYDVKAKSATADMSGDTAHSLKGAGKYTVKVISNNGWAYLAGEQEIVIPDDDKSDSTTGKYNATFTTTIENADVVYFNWHNSSDVSNVAFTPATSGFTVNDYTTSSEPGYIVFFVKPHDNYIVTGLNASGNGDMYAVDGTNWGNIAGYPGISTVMAAAKAAGYVASFGYYRGAKSSMSQNFTVSAKSPDMTITAVSDKTENVAAGDELTFTVTITPKTTGSGKDKVTGVEINSAEINGAKVEVENLTKNSDGTYSGTVHYTATDADCGRGVVALSVEATTKYEGTFTISSGGLTTGAEVTKSASCTCKIAPTSSVQYEFVSGTAGKTLPSAIYNYLPWDNGKYGAEKTVKAKDPEKEKYDDASNNGYWTFTGWDQNSKKTDRKGTGVTFTGTWAFTEYSKYTIKYVDEKGNEIAEPNTVSGNKVGDKIKVSSVEKPMIAGYSYSKTNPSSELKISDDDSKNVITLTYKQKAGKAGYYLVLGDATWGAPSNTSKESGSQKWYYDYGFAKGDTFVVTDSTPSAENHVFIGWMDKERDGQAAAIRKAGDEVTYCYGNDKTYTLDALWASLSAEGEDVTYDGKAHTLSVDVNINEGTGLKSEYAEQAKSLISAGNVQYSTDGGNTWSTTAPTYTDSGEYPVKVKQDVTVGSVTTTLTAETTVKIARKTYYVSTSSDTKAYDGQKLVGTATVEGLISGESAAATATTIGPDVTGETSNAVTGEIVWGANTKSSNYVHGTDQLGALEITKRDVTLKSADLEKPYDGTALTNGDAKLVAETGWVEGEGATYAFTGAQTEVGESGNAFSYTLNANTKADNYNITKSEGTLKVAARAEKYEVSVYGNEGTFTYDGQSHTVSGPTSTTYTNDKGVTFTISGLDFSASGKDAGSYAGTVTGAAKVTDPSGNDVTSQFEVTAWPGQLTISPKAVTITAGSATKEYDGSALTADQANPKYTAEGFVGDEGLDYDSVRVTGSQTEVGSSQSNVNQNFLVPKRNTNMNNYVVSLQPGTLTVTDRTAKYQIELEGVTETKTYNGSDQTMYGVKTDEFEIDGVKFKVKNYKSGVTGKDAGDYTQTITSTNEDGRWTVVDANGNDVSAQFSVTPKAGKLTISPKDVTITSGSDSKTYDGAELTKHEAGVTAGGFVEGEEAGVSYIYTGSQTNVGSSKNAFSVVFDGTNAKAGNYNVTQVEGDLTVNKLSAANLNLSGTNVSVVYDADSHSAGTATATPKDSNGNALSDAVTIEYQLASDPYGDWYSDPNAIKQTNATTEPVVVNVRATSPNFDGAATATETITITKRPVQIKTKSATKVYDGSALTTKNDWDGYEVLPYQNGGIVYGDYAIGSDGYPVIECTGSQTEVGSSSNTVNYQIKADRLGNYEISDPVLGTLTVTAQSINPGTDSEVDPSYKGVQVGTLSDVTYNGQSQQQKPSVTTKDGVSLTEGTDYTVAFSEDTTDAGTVTVTVTGIGNYSGTVTRTYKINQRELTVTTPGASKVYDGAALTTAGAWADCVSGYVEGEAAAFRTTGGITEPGSADNTYAIDWNAEGNTAKQGNYTIKSETLGQLVVSKQSIVPVPDNPDAYKGIQINSPTNVTYDATEHKWAPTVTDGAGNTLTEGADYAVAYGTDDFTNVGTITVTITGMGNYTGTATRAYTIDKRAVILTSESKAFTYNGKAQSWNKYTCSDDLFAGQVDGLGCAASVTNVGDTAENTVNYAFKTGFSADNYAITTQFGTLSVKNSEDEITVTTTGGTWTYDGQAHGATVTVSALPEGYTLAEAKSNASETDVTSAGGETAKADALKIVNANGDDVTSSLKIAYVDGTIVINPAPLTVTTPDATKVYDGSALKAEGSYSRLVEGESIDFTTTGSQTEVGESDNGYKIAWTGAKSYNYTVSESVGKLTVTKQSINPGTDPTNPDPSYNGVQVGTLTNVVYNGQNQEQKPTVTDKDGNPLTEGTDYKVTFSADTKNAGTVTVTIEGQGNYTGTVTRTYSITKRPVTIVSGDASKTYDGEALTSSAANVTSELGFVAGEVTGIRATGTITNCGSAENTIAYDVHEDKGFKASNYDIAEQPGELTVTKAPAEDNITLTAMSWEKQYDGDAIALSCAVATASVWTDRVTIEYSVDGTNWTTDYSSITATNVSDSKTVRVRASSPANYEGYVYAEAALTVTRRNVSLTSGTQAFDYDGTAHTLPDVTISGDGFVDGEVGDVKATGSVTHVSEGKVQNTITYAPGANFKAGNYNITEQPGELSVNGKSLSDESISVDQPTDVTYDGDAHKFVPVVKDGEKTLVPGTDYDVNYSTDNFTDATGTITVTITGKGNYADTVTRTYQIKPASLSIETDSASKTYNGEALTAGGKVTGLVDGETVTFETTGAQTAVGESDNTYSLKFDKTAKSSNYVVTGEKIGKLTVTESAGTIVVTTTGGTFTYDGVLHGAGVDVQGIPEGYKLGKAVCTATAKNVSDGEVKAACEQLVILNAADEDVTSKLNIKYIDGTIKVTPATLTVSTGSDSKAYDGEALTAEGSISGLVKGETATFTVSGSQTYVGESDNTYDLVFDGTADKANYTVAATLGKLTVTEPTDNGKVVTKTHQAGTYGVGDKVAFTITATNIYNTAKTITIGEIAGVELDQSVFENVQPGATVTAAATYTVTEADVLRGTFVNTATASFSGTDKTYPGTDEVDVDKAEAHLTVTKATTSMPANGSTYALGEQIAYDVTVTNDGNLTATGVVVEDQLAGAALAEGQSAEVGTLAPGASATVKYVYAVTEADVLAGMVKNTATAFGKTDGGDPTVTPGEKADKTEPKNGHVTVTKVATSEPADGNAYKLGETISYKITVTNDGNLTVNNVEVTDANADGFGEKTIASLAPGASAEFDATHVVTEADVRAGSVVNTATATGTSVDPDKPVVPVEPGTDTEPTDTPDAALTVTKTAEQNGSATDGAFKLGETINYSITVKNTGNQTVENVTVTDPNADGFGEKTVASLEPGQSESFTATHKVTEADILAGKVINTATAKGADPSGNDVDGEGTDTKTIDELNTTLDVEKTASAPANGTAYVLGEEVTYTVTVTNKGNVAYNNVKVADPKTGLNVTIPSLAVGESQSYPTRHVITEADIAAGTYANTATATADAVTDPKTDTPVTPSGEDTEVIGGDEGDYPIDGGRADLVVSKTVTNRGTGENGAFKLGDVIEYQIAVTNNGNLTAKNFQVVDNNADGFAAVTVASLAPGETTEAISASHTVTSDDILAGRVVNVATTNGGSTDDPKVVPTPEPGETETDVDKLDTTLDVEKTASASANNTAYVLGEEVAYTITVTNKGNVPYTNVKVADAQTGLSETIASLAVGEFKEFTTTHVITEADIVAGSYKNTATATADPVKDPATGRDVTPSGEGTETIGGKDSDKPIDKANPKLVVTKSSDVAEGALLKEGDVVNYTVTAKNTGNLTLTNVVVTDELEGAVLAAGESSTIASLAPDASVTLHYSYVVTQADVVAGKVANTATADADNPSDKKTDVTPGETDDPTETASASLYVKKTADKTSGVVAGDVISYTITAINNGNVDLTGVVVTDELTGFASEPVDIKKGDSATFTTTYTVTEADMVAGSVKNVATATATDPSGNEVPGSGETTTETEDVDGALKVEKTAAAGAYAAGDTVTYAIKVENTGNVTLYNVAVTDPLTGLSKTINSLAPNDPRTFETTYVVTEADIAAGALTNTATAKGTDPAGDDVTGTDTLLIDDSAQPDPDNPDKPTLKRELNVGELSDVVYNGAAQELVPVVTDKYGNVLVLGRDFTVTYAGDTTNVTDGGVTATVTGIGNYAGTAERSYKISPATLTVTTPDATKVYDGAALTAEGSYVGLVNGETIGFATTGSQTATGSSTNAYEIEWADAGVLGLIGGNAYTAKKSNYTVAEDLGALTVTAQSIDPGTDPENPDPAYKGVQINSPSDVVYDAAEHKWAPTVTDAAGNLLTEGMDYAVSYGTDDFTNAGGAITVTITGIGSFSGTVAREYKITPAQITVTTGSATRVYNGQALTSAVLAIEGLKGKDSVTARTTGSQTEVGSSQNTYSMSWTGALASNYVIARETLGILTVTAAPVTPTPDNGGNTPVTPADNGGATTTTPANATGTTTAAATPIDAVANALEDAYEALTGDVVADEAPAEQIYDEENPLGAAEKHTCWVHFWILLGIVATAIYGAFVWFRRTNHTRKLRKNMNDILGGGNEPDEDRSAAGSATPAGMEA